MLFVNPLLHRNYPIAQYTLGTRTKGYRMFPRPLMGLYWVMGSYGVLRRGCGVDQRIMKREEVLG